MKKVVFVANRGYALKSSREKLISNFLENGFEVLLLTTKDDYSKSLLVTGVALEEINVNRGGLRIFNDIKLLLKMLYVYRKHRPVLIHHFHAKPVILGTIAARLSLGKNVKIVNSITGLGHAFITGGWIRSLAIRGYKIALNLSDAVIFQNIDDKNLFIDHKWLPEPKSHLIVSSGVDTYRFPYVGNTEAKNPDQLNVLMVGRLIGQKGVFEYISAASIVRARYPNVKFLLAGEFDKFHPDSIDDDELQNAIDSQTIEYLGYISDMPKMLRDIDIFVLPSYREGVPRAVLEAASSGIPSVGADVPGTREAIRNTETGYLVEVRNSALLVSAIEKLVSSKELRVAMGEAARNMAVREFDINVIITQHFSLYKSLGIVE